MQLDLENVNCVDKFNRTLLFHAVIENLVDMVSFLIKKGADCNAQDDEQWYPLHYAAQNQNVAIAKILLSNGADVDGTDSYGNTPLHRATYDSEGRREMIKFLLSKGANPNRENKYGISAKALAKSIDNYDLSKLF